MKVNVDSEVVTKFVKVKSRDDIPSGIGLVKNLTRPNLFGCLYRDENLNIVEDKGILGVEADVFLFKEKLDAGIVSLLQSEKIDYNNHLGERQFVRKANVTLYYIHSSMERDIF